MALSDVSFNRNQYGQGRPLPGNDYISGMIFYSNTYPSGFSSGSPIKKMFSLNDAVNYGITKGYSDETKPTGGNVLITTKGASGDTDSIYLDGVLLASIAGGQTDAATEAGLFRTAINAVNSQYGTGIVASGSGANVALAVALGVGKSMQYSGCLSFASVSSTGTTGSGQATVTQFSGGVGSLINVMYYHIGEFFRIQPKGVLYVGVFAIATYTGAEIKTVQNYANNSIRQMSVCLGSTAFLSSQLSASQSYCTTLQGLHAPLSILLHADCSSLSLSTMSDLSQLTNKNTSFILGTEGKHLMGSYSVIKNYVIGDEITWMGKCYQANQNGTGNPVYDPNYWIETIDNLFTQNGFSISNIGAELGMVSYVNVNESIAWVNKCNLSDGTNLEDIGFATGKLLTDSSITTALLAQLDNYHYIFMRQFANYAGSYNNFAWTAISGANDYCTIEKNRTMDKCEREVYLAEVPNLNMPVYINADGTLTYDTICKLENDANIPLIEMKKTGELSDYLITIDPTQDVLTTDQIVITLQNIATGVAKQIIINSGFTTKIVS